MSRAAGQRIQPNPRKGEPAMNGSFPEAERDRYVSRGLGYVVLLNGAAALILVALVAFDPQSASNRLGWAMMVFGSGALAGLSSSLLAYLARLLDLHRPGRVIIRDFLRVTAIVVAIGAGAAFMTGLNMMFLTLPEGSSTRPKNRPKTQTPSPTNLRVKHLAGTKTLHHAVVNHHQLPHA
jgi:hypothetical protein